MQLSRFQKPLLIFVLLLSIWRQPAQATEQLYLDYLIEWARFDLGHTTASWVFKDKQYQMFSDANTEGTGAFFYDYYGESELSGALNEAGAFIPLSLRTYSKTKKEERDAVTNWAARLPETTRNPELDLEEVFPLDPASLPNTIDPFSAMLNALQKVSQTGSCAGTYQIYDGRRRSDIELFDLGKADLIADRPTGYTGPSLVCGLVGKPIGGQRRDSEWDESDLDPSRIKFYLAQLGENITMRPAFVPVRIEMDGFLGNVIVRLDMQASLY